jgi:beta-glucosidase-like glycosyl hydrolase/CubicO group peptidase (beta-lactamase class C family)
MSNYLQRQAKIPLLTSIDAEWGLAMRMDSVMAFPVQMALGAVDNDLLIYEMGRAIARQLKRLGLQINFAPVLDVNNNPLNPVINVRSFGDDKKMVVEKAEYYMQGLQDEHVLAVGKHFPGHGDTKTDSHHDLPYLNFSRKRLDSLELYPFKEIIKKGIGGIMVAHLDVPVLDPIHKHPSTLSHEIVTDLLRNEFEFEGVIFTDALNMKGATKYYKPGEVALKALLAGNDILLYPEEIPWAIQYIKESIEDSVLCIDELNAHVKRVLTLKYWTGLNHFKYVDTTNLYNDLNTATDKLLQRKLVENSLTVLKNKNELIPLQRLDTLKIAYVSFDKKTSETFYNTLSLYAPIDSFVLPEKPNQAYITKLLDTLKNYNLIITSLHQTHRYSFRTFNFSNESLDFLKLLASNHQKIILSVFASPYSLDVIPDVSEIKSLILSYESNDITQDLTAQLIFGGVTALGRLPVNVSAQFPYKSGLDVTDIIRIKYTVPEELGISAKKLCKIDSIISYAIRQKAFPGCQVIAIKNGKVFYHKAFGNLFYDSLPVTNQSIYDLASVTKVAATTLVTMHLFDENKLDVHRELNYYYPAAKGTDKEHLSIGDILSHQSRLTAWIPFYKDMIKDSLRKHLYFSKSYSKNFPYQVADTLFACKGMKDTVYKRILASKLLPSKKYVYSDLGFYLMKEVDEKLSQKTLPELCDSLFYKSLGCVTMTFNPLNKFERKRMAPTENDKEFRQQLIWGYVHDPGASLTGGVQGHAGLFSDANDLAKIGQLLLWNGDYGGQHYFKPSTVKYFTSCYSCPQNRRGLGFDKPEPNEGKESPVTRNASMLTFGHQGFTGTCIWVDPEYNLVYVFLSNRVYPSAENNKITQLGIRNKVLDVIYEAIKK